MRWCQRVSALARAIASGAFMIAIAACGVTDAERVAVDAIDVTPDALQLSAGATSALDAQVMDAAGNVLGDRRIVWASSNPSVATVSERGVVTAVNPGRADIAATAEGKTGVAEVTVTALPAVVSSVRLTPNAANLFVAESVNLVATALDSHGSAIGGRTVVWTTNNVAVASVSQTGRVTGLIPGNATITAVIDGQAATAAIAVRVVPVSRVTVTPGELKIDPGKTATLTARALDAAGNQLSGRTVVWSSSDTRIVTVDQTGKVRGVRRGSAVVTATVEGKFGTSTVRVD